MEADCVLLSVSFRGLWEQDALPRSALHPAAAAAAASWGLLYSVYILCILLCSFICLFPKGWLYFFRPLPAQERERQYHHIHQLLSSILQRSQRGPPPVGAPLSAVETPPAATTETKTAATTETKTAATTETKTAATTETAGAAAAAAAGAATQEEKAAAATRFLSLVADCELDTRRVLRESQQRRVEVAQEVRGPSKRPSGGPPDEEGGQRTADTQGGAPRGLLVMSKGGTAKRNKHAKRIQHQGVKKDLGLKGIEDFAGIEGALLYPLLFLTCLSLSLPLSLSVSLSLSLRCQCVCPSVDGLGDGLPYASVSVSVMCLRLCLCLSLFVSLSLSVSVSLCVLSFKPCPPAPHVVDVPLVLFCSVYSL